MSHSDQTKRQTRPVDGRRADMQPALSGDLIEQVLDRDNLNRAWKQVKSNRGAPGVDQMTLEEFPEMVHKRWLSIRQSIRDGTYRPKPVRRKEIPKPMGGKRALWIPTIRPSAPLILGSFTF